MLTRKEFRVLNKFMKDIILLRNDPKVSNDYLVGIQSAALTKNDIKELQRLTLKTDDTNNLVLLPKEVNEWITQYKDNSFKKNISLIALVFSVVSIIFSLVL